MNGESRQRHTQIRIPRRCHYLHIAARPRLQHYVLVIDGANPIAVQPFVVLVEHRIRLAVPSAQALGRTSAKVPESTAVEVHTRRVGDVLIERHAALGVVGRTPAEVGVAGEQRVCKGCGREDRVALAVPVRGFALFETDEDVLGAVNVKLVKEMMFCPTTTTY